MDSTNNAHWDVEGHYDITIADAFDSRTLDPLGPVSMDIDGFKLSLFYWSASEPRQLYANFSFDKLQGIMRLCPRDLSPGSEKNPPDLKQFKQLCYLDAAEVPVENSSWMMRWRGRDGGLRLDELVGDESRSIGPFSFEEGTKLIFLFIYNDNLFRFQAIKIADLAAHECAEAPSVLEREWEQLDANAQESDTQSDSTATESSGERPGSTSASISQISKKKSSVAAPPKAPSRSQTARQKPQSSSRPEQQIQAPSGIHCIEEMPDWAYCVRGSYKVTRAFEFFDTDAEDIKLEIKISNSASSFKAKR